MAPIESDEARPLKRTSTTAGFDAPIIALKHHSLHWQQKDAGLRSGICQDDEVLQTLLRRSIMLALDAVGFENADPIAIESFQAEVEEYMLHFLTNVRQSMLSSRRTQPIPRDFLHALERHQLTLRSLIPHLNPPVAPSRSQITLNCEPTCRGDDHKHDQIIANLLNGPLRATSTSCIPQHFPALPSKHTYKFEEMFTSRETDPQKVRERATEEGRLGEEALRKLVGVCAEEASVETSQRSRRKPTVREQTRALWKETMEAVTAAERETLMFRSPQPDRGPMELDVPASNTNTNMGYLSAAVNSDRVYWRKGGPKRLIDPETAVERTNGVT
ncbi:hypothetical protein MMC13_000076 [Lambiella insularis]|nr:hypothetical protein [Lambiella insularis]